MTPSPPSTSSSLSHNSDSDSDASDFTDASSDKSDSVTYVTDIGSPVERDPSDAPYPVISRIAIARTYDSSSASDDDEDGTGDGDDGDGGVDSDGDKIDIRNNSNKSNIISDISINNNNAGGGGGGGGSDDDGMVEISLKNGVIGNGNPPVMINDHNSINSNQHHQQQQPQNQHQQQRQRQLHSQRHRQRQRQRQFHHQYRRPRCNRNCDRARALQQRVDNIAQELASLQVVTASRAADADVLKSFASDTTSDGLLRGEVCRLRITLDHVTRLALENAFHLRDQLEHHR